MLEFALDGLSSLAFAEIAPMFDKLCMIVGGTLTHIAADDNSEYRLTIIARNVTYRFIYDVDAATSRLSVFAKRDFESVTGEFHEYIDTTPMGTDTSVYIDKLLTVAQLLTD